MLTLRCIIWLQIFYFAWLCLVLPSLVLLGGWGRGRKRSGDTKREVSDIAAVTLNFSWRFRGAKERPLTPFVSLSPFLRATSTPAAVVPLEQGFLFCFHPGSLLTFLCWGKMDLVNEKNFINNLKIVNNQKIMQENGSDGQW